MTASQVDVHELIAWSLDDYCYRDTAIDFNPERLTNRVKQARGRLVERGHFTAATALLEPETKAIEHLLNTAARREDLQQDYQSLDWTLGVIDLRLLLAFQRRLVFNPLWPVPISPKKDEWPQLISMTIGLPRSTEHALVHNGSGTDRLDISLHSSNPDLQLRFHPKTSRGELLPLSLYGGNPFFEVAEFRGRWFLRDGYHRAYHLLQVGIDHIPAVVIYARSIEELGATAPWFFSEEDLFSEYPPRVTDFLDEEMTLCYKRTALRKVIRIRIEESLEESNQIEAIQGERL